MKELKLGQVVEFFRPVEIDGRTIPKGARARVAHILAELLEPKLVLVLLDEEKPEPLIVERHVVAVSAVPVSAPAAMKLGSSAFADHGAIPDRYTCEGEGVSPPLSWHAVPPHAKSLALIVDDPDAPDPDAPKTTWVHWLLYDLPRGADGLAEAVSSLPPGTLEGLNDWGRTGYGAPCPPLGRHRYFFRLYALDVALPDLRRPRKPALETAMRGHVLEEAQLVGTYRRQKP